MDENLPTFGTDTPDDDSVYEAYLSYTQQSLAYRRRLHQATANRLREDKSHDHTAYIADLTADANRSYLLDSQGFVRWWSSLGSQRQADLLELYTKPFEDTIAEVRTAVREMLDDDDSGRSRKTP